MTLANSNNLSFEEKTSAITLSDMEIFVFPRLFYSIVLANILSPIIWEWKKDPWFKDIHKKSPRNRIIRLKQFIMDNYVFNLDLETWGLTNKQKEISRFKNFIDTDKLKQANALFGYEGDKYYFDIDIRTHFGLDKYKDDLIPYWKTETLEAMDAFKYKPGYPSGAGECVSLSTLYAAALFIVAEIPLEKIFLLATPLHSQNFVDVGQGLLTNNRRLVTKNMWFNGTPISMKARRALENEQVTIISHISGHMHTLYEEAYMSEDTYIDFKQKIRAFLKTELDTGIFASFLRSSKDVHICLQYECEINGKKRYIELEKLFDYELKRSFFFSGDTRAKLIESIDPGEFHSSMIPDRILLNDIEYLLEEEKIDISNPQDIEKLKKSIGGECINSIKLISSLIDFCITDPRLPSDKKNFITEPPIDIKVGMGREEIKELILSLRNVNRTAELALYAFRDLNLIDAEPFLKGALERNPVSYEAMKEMSQEQIIEKVSKFSSTSIYPGDGRLAQPDEVFNYATGDGLEKALLIASVLKDESREKNISIDIQSDKILLKIGDSKTEFSSTKKIRPQKWELYPVLKVTNHDPI
ncbi:MAG: hypothetical protein GX817_00265 [Elusimicrobia bacterium]|nr:hypothetical protein [Elusimicrobiota bacterium]